MALKIIPLILSFVLLEAHFLRTENLVLTVGCVLFPFVLLLKARWSLVAVQAVLYFGVAIWVSTAFRIARQRMMMGEPWGRMTLILGAVALWTFFSAIIVTPCKDKE